MKDFTLLFFKENEEDHFFDTSVTAVPFFQKGDIVELTQENRDRSKWNVSEFNQKYEILKIEYSFAKSYTTSSIVESLCTNVVSFWVRECHE